MGYAGSGAELKAEDDFITFCERMKRVFVSVHKLMDHGLVWEHKTTSRPLSMVLDGVGDAYHIL